MDTIMIVWRWSWCDWCSPVWASDDLPTCTCSSRKACSAFALSNGRCRPPSSSRQRSCRPQARLQPAYPAIRNTSNSQERFYPFCWFPWFRAAGLEGCSSAVLHSVPQLSRWVRSHRWPKYHQNLWDWQRRGCGWWTIQTPAAFLSQLGLFLRICYRILLPCCCGSGGSYSSRRGSLGRCYFCWEPGGWARDGELSNSCRPFQLSWWA